MGSKVRPTPSLKRRSLAVNKDSVVKEGQVAGKTTDLAVHLVWVQPVPHQHLGNGVDMSYLVYS